VYQKQYGLKTNGRQRDYLLKLATEQQTVLITHTPENTTPTPIAHTHTHTRRSLTHQYTHSNNFKIESIILTLMHISNRSCRRRCLDCSFSQRKWFIGEMAWSLEKREKRWGKAEEKAVKSRGSGLGGSISCNYKQAAYVCFSRSFSAFCTGC